MCYLDQILGSVLFVRVVLVWLALTFFREKLVLYSISGGHGKIWFNNVLFLINVQCFQKIPLILFMSSEYCVTKATLSN